MLATLIIIGIAIAVAIASILLHRHIPKRPPVAHGRVQTYPRIIPLIVSLGGIACVLGGGYYWYSVTTFDTDAIHLPVLLIVGGCLLLAWGYFSARYAVIVTPDSIEVINPFRGTMIITHNNLLVPPDTHTFSGSPQTRFVIDDDGRKRRISIGTVQFDLSAFMNVEHAQQHAHPEIYSGRYVRSGDYFTIPLRDDRVYIGHVLALREGIYPYVYIYDHPLAPDELDEVATALESPILLAGLLADTDDYFAKGLWVTIGNESIDSLEDDEGLPALQAGTPERPMVQTFTGCADKPVSKSTYVNTRPAQVSTPDHLIAVIDILDSSPTQLKPDSIYRHDWPTSTEMFGVL